MSLRDFHILFIVCSIVITQIFGVWALDYSHQSGSAGYFITAITSFALGLFLIIYLVLFLQKIKNEKQP